MTKVDGSISSLIQGVSQQPERERLAGQCTEQINCTSDVVNGLARRAPTSDIAELINSSDAYKFKEHDAGSDGFYIIAYKAGDIKVFNLDGSEATVTIVGSAGSYLSGNTLAMEGIEDDIFVVDTGVTVQSLSDTKDQLTEGSLAFLLGGQYGRTYTITVTYNTSSTITVFYQTPNGSSASHIENIATTYIATELETELNADANFPSLFSVTRADDVLHIEATSPSVTSFTVEVEDGDGGNNMFAVNGEVDDVGDLPRYAPNGYVVKVSESISSEADDWYLEFNTSEDYSVGDGFGKDGLWLETTAPDIEYKLDPATMPHVLTKTGTNTFDFEQGEWADRAVGDDNTNPMPSFVGESINHVNSFQGRLALTSDVNLIMSRNNKPFDFFKQSATTVADTDPIDISSALGTFVLRKMVAHNRDLIIFSDKAQFIMFGRNVITPKNSSLVLTTKFEADLSLGTDPVAAGRNIIFPYQYGSFVGLQEFFTSGSEDINDSRPITQHVSKYIEGRATLLTSTTNFNKLLVHTDDDLKKLYLYEYIWVDQQKVQSSWSTWVFDKDVLSSFFVDSVLYLVQRDGDSYRLRTLDLDDTPEEGVGYRVMLDEQLEVDPVNTTFTVPYSIDDINEYIVVQGEGCPYPGMRANIQDFTGSTVTLSTDMQGGTIYFGRKYTSEYTPTMPFVRDSEGVKISSGKLTIKSITIHFNDTGYFQATVTDDHGYENTVTYNGRTLGAPTNLIGQPAIVDGDYKVPVKKNADTSDLKISSDSHLPFYLLEMEWLGQWKKKGKRIAGG